MVNVVDNSVIGRNIIDVHDAENTETDAIDAVYVSDVQNNVGVVNSSDGLITKIDVTVYPQDLSSFSQCLYFTSTRSNRLKLLRDTAIWRSIGLLCGWLFTVLFVFWLSSILSLSSFPENPFKFFLSEKKSKKK